MALAAPRELNRLGLSSRRRGANPARGCQVGPPWAAALLTATDLWLRKRRRLHSL